LYCRCEFVEVEVTITIIIFDDLLGIECVQLAQCKDELFLVDWLVLLREVFIEYLLDTFPIPTVQAFLHLQ
jgi:hypothetical protein